MNVRRLLDRFCLAIGTVGIPDSILLKPGKLTTDEFEIMKTHTTLGFEAIERAEQQLGIKVDFLATAKQIALSHQEKWDGSGYPNALRGTEIPLAARLMAVADVLDAVLSLQDEVQSTANRYRDTKIEIAEKQEISYNLV